MPAARVKTAATVNPGERLRIRMLQRVPPYWTGLQSQNAPVRPDQTGVESGMVTTGARTRGGMGIAVSARSGAPPYEQIYAAVRDAIVGGSLRPGAKIASTRALAAELSVS